MNDTFDSKDGEQNIAQGDHPIDKQVNNFFCRLLGRIFTTGNQSPAIGAGGNVAVTYVVPSEDVAKYAKELGATEQLINSFFGTLLERNVPRDQWDETLREIAAHYKDLKELLQNWEAVQSADPQIVKLKAAAKQALDAGSYAKAESLLEDIAKHYLQPCCCPGQRRQRPPPESTAALRQGRRPAAGG